MSVDPAAGRAHVRDIASLWPYRQRRALVLACVDEAAAIEERRTEIEAMDAALVVEREAGPLSARLGRPSVTVADRFGSVALVGSEVSWERVLAELEGFALACPECGPQAWGNPAA